MCIRDRVVPSPPGACRPGADRQAVLPLLRAPAAAQCRGSAALPERHGCLRDGHSGSRLGVFGLGLARCVPSALL
eukprot:14222651-Alexandrium_andersonii.AAC.1